MCGRYFRTTPPDAIAALVQAVDRSAGCSPRYDIAPTQMEIICRAQDNVREVVNALWGFLPHASQRATTTGSIASSAPPSPR